MAPGTSWARTGCSTETGYSPARPSSRPARNGCVARWRRSCCPTMTTSGARFTRAVASAATALPSPAVVCRIASAGSFVASARPVASPTTEASWRASTKRRSSGSPESSWISVDPGLAKMVVRPRSRRTSNAASRTVVVVMVAMALCVLRQRGDELGLGVQQLAERPGPAAGQELHGVARDAHLAGGDADVRPEPSVDLPALSVRPRGPRLLDGLLLVADGTPADLGEDLGRLGERDRLRPGHLVDLPLVPLGRQDRRRDAGDVLPGDPGDATVRGGSADDAVLDEQRRVLAVHAVAQGGELQSGLADRALRERVVAREGERRLGRRAEERRVDDALDAGVGDRRHDAAVEVHPVGRLVRGGEEDRPHAVERRAERVRVLVVGFDDLGTCDLRRAGGIADEQAHGRAEVGEVPDDEPAELPGGAGDGDRCSAI